MKRIVTFAVSVMFVAGLATVSFAAEVKKDGAIKSIDAKAGTVTITCGKADVTVKGEAGTAKVGDKVTVTYDDKTNVAKLIKKNRGGKVPVGC